jgi:hypothetical protein
MRIAEPTACDAMYEASGKGKQPHGRDPGGVPTNQWRYMMRVQQQLWAPHMVPGQHVGWFESGIHPSHLK